MLSFPSRVSELITRIESGQELTPADLQRAQRLQALDIAKAGEDYLRQTVERLEARDQEPGAS